MSDTGGWSTPGPPAPEGPVPPAGRPGPPSPEPAQPHPGWSAQQPPPSWGYAGQAPPPPPPPGYGPPPPGYGPPPGSGPAGYLAPAAPKPGVVPLRPLGISELLDGAISTVRANPGVMLGFSAIVVSIVSIGTFFATLTLFQDLNAATAALGENADLSQVLDAFSGSIGGLLLSAVLGWFAQTILSGLLTVVVGDAVLGRKATLSDAWARIRPRILPLLGLSILIQLSWMAGLALCVIPGIFIYVMLALAPPALVLERSSVTTSMKRSWRLVKGAWWRCFGVLALTAILTYVIAQVVSVPFGILSGLGGVGFGFEPTDTSYSVLAVALTTLGSIVAGTITYPFTAAVTALLYVDQRMRREALDLELARAAAAPPAG